MKTIKMLCWLLPLLFSTIYSQTDSCGNFNTQTEMNICHCNELKKADNAMNNIYQRVLSKYKDDKVFISKFKNAQRKWIALRDADLQALYPSEEPGEYGSVNPMCRCIILLNMTKERIKWISQWDLGVSEGDVCSGSIKINE